MASADSTRNQSGSGGSSVSGKRRTKPSSPQRVSTSGPPAARMRALTAMAQGMWMRLPKGVRTQTRQSPSSSRTALDDDGAVVGDLAGGGFLIGEELEEIFGGAGIEIVLGDEAGERGGLGQGAEFADERADAAAELERAAGAVAFPEGHFAGLAGSGGDEDAVVGDFDDAPGGCAEDEGLAGMALEDHLFVELADADGLAFAVGEEDAVEAAVGDGAGVEDGEAGGAVAGGDDVADAVPGEAGAELGEFVGGVAAAEQIEDAFKGGAGECAEGSGAADEVEEEVDADFGFGVGELSRCDRSCVAGSIPRSPKARDRGHPDVIELQFCGETLGSLLLA